MAYDQPLARWLSGEHYYQKSLTYITQEAFVLRQAWLAIDHQVALHEAHEVKLRPFYETWIETQTYLENACRLLNRNMPGWAPKQPDANRVILALGEPPLRCYAIYLITVERGGNEDCVYVGQTNSKHHRFKSGHRALSALHHTDYDGLKKRIYFAGLQLQDDDDHSFPIEWVHPVALRKEALNSIEARLIYDLQPELNTQGKDYFLGPLDLPVTAQNMLSSFLNTRRFGPPVPDDD